MKAVQTESSVKMASCPHCGGLHFGQRYDNCTYVNLLADPTATEEQKVNAAERLRFHRESK